MNVIDRVNIRLKELLEYVKFLEGFKDIEVKKLETDLKTRGAIERYLQLACEVVLDIANILNAEYKLTPAKDSKDSILILGKKGVLDKKFSKEFSKIAGFRNILVHDYLEIDCGQVADKINNRLGDFEKFVKAVAKFIGK